MLVKQTKNMPHETKDSPGRTLLQKFECVVQSKTDPQNKCAKSFGLLVCCKCFDQLSRIVRGIRFIFFRLIHWLNLKIELWYKCSWWKLKSIICWNVIRAFFVVFVWFQRHWSNASMPSISTYNRKLKVHFIAALGKQRIK